MNVPQHNMPVIEKGHTRRVWPFAAATSSAEEDP